MATVGSFQSLSRFRSELSLGDGTVGVTSFRKISHPWKDSADEVVSDVPLAGAITGLHLVQDRRTGEGLLVGGANDGSIAFWSLKCVALAL